MSFLLLKHPLYNIAMAIYNGCSNNEYYTASPIGPLQLVKGRNVHKVLRYIMSRYGCGRGHNEFAGRVQNYRVRSSCHRNFLEIEKVAAGQDTESCRLREGCHCGCLPSH